MSKVCVYAISKNEELFVDRFMDSVQQADSVIVLDTGSTDKTVEKLKARGALVHQQIIKPWRFDVARNVAINLCGILDPDIFLSLDLDEVVSEPDWKDRILSVWKPHHNRARYKYVWNILPDGSDGHSFTYEKIHDKNYEWYLPCHEILRRRSDKPGYENWAELDITVRHYPDGTKSRGNYLGLLKLAVEEDPNNDRMAHYYGRELFFQSKWADAIKELTRHVKLPTATWEDERAQSMSMIAKCYEALKNDLEAERWHFRACAEAIHLREPFINSAKFYNNRNRYPMGYAMAKRAMQIETKATSYISTPYAQNEGPYDLTSTAAYYIGLKPESLAYARKAYELAPWDGRLKENVEIVERMCPELTVKHQSPQILEREFWSLNPSFGLVVSTHGSLPYIHLALEVRNKYYKDVPTLIVDDCSPEKNDLLGLCKKYGVDFYCNESNLNHTRGDVTAFATGLRWAKAKKLDVLIKMSRRFVPKKDWRPSLREIIKTTMHATYSGTCDPTWGLRTECIALHVPRWYALVDQLEKEAKNASWLWVEKLMYDKCLGLLKWGVGDQNGVALWEFPGLGKWVKSDSHLWHDTSDPKDYQEFASSLGLCYNTQDF
jgi:glycosyltransferase involved in cell wall biosynthesis